MAVLVVLLLIVAACASATAGVWLLFGFGWALIALAPCLVFLGVVVGRGIARG